MIFHHLLENIHEKGIIMKKNICLYSISGKFPRSSHGLSHRAQELAAPSVLSQTPLTYSPS